MDKIQTNIIIGEITLYTGPMYAGKSNQVVEVVEACIKNNENFICFKHTFDDNRFGKNEVVSRTGKKTIATSVANYKNIKTEVEKNEKIKTIKTIIIDELQFFGIDNKEEVEGFIKMLQNFSKQGKKIILAGLDKDFKNEYFPLTKRLIEDGLIQNENIKYLKATCSVKNCCENGTCTARIIENKELIDVGNGTKYKAVCHKHHNYNEKINYNEIEWKNEDEISGTKNKKKDKNWQNRVKKRNSYCCGMFKL